jgi:hypothetical protein
MGKNGRKLLGATEESFGRHGQAIMVGLRYKNIKCGNMRWRDALRADLSTVWETLRTVARSNVQIPILMGMAD